MGRPKALVRTAAGRPWVDLAVETVLGGGCDGVVVVLGASAEEARGLVPDIPSVRVVVAPAWSDGLGASLAAGLHVVGADDDVDAVLVSLVDLPGMPAAAVRRVLGGVPDPGAPRAPGLGPSALRPATPGTSALLPSVLRRAVHDGRPGHPVLIGRGHWDPLTAALDDADADDGDRGAGAYLRSAGAESVECGDLWDGTDQDRPGPATR
jgi:CTP:molybdopterin cytidylyltransferase MocA